MGNPQSALPRCPPAAVSPDAPTKPVLYWIGLVDEKGLEFELENAKGPFRLDLGDVLYAPNVLQDDQVRKGQDILFILITTLITCVPPPNEGKWMCPRPGLRHRYSWVGLSRWQALEPSHFRGRQPTGHFLGPQALAGVAG